MIADDTLASEFAWDLVSNNVQHNKIIPVMHERNSREAGKLWFDLSKSTKHRTGDVGQINPLDLLIHIIARVNFTTKESGFTIWLYRWQRRLRTRILAIFQARPFWQPDTVLMLPIEPTHITQMVPVAKVMLASGTPVVFLTTRVRMHDLLRAQNMPVFLLAGRTSGLAQRIFTPLRNVYATCPPTLLPRARQFLARYYAEMLAVANELLCVFDISRPKYILIGNDLTWEGRLLARLAAKFNYRTGMVQHGLLGHEPVNKYHIVQDFFVYGPTFKAILLNDGLEGVNVIVTGAPYLDDMPAKDTDHPHPEIKRRFRLRDRFVLVALSGFGHRTSVENYRLTLEWINRMIRNHPELEFVIKLHRKERIVAYKDFSGEQKSRIVDNKRGKDLPQSIFDWLKGCSCLITGTSTVAYEAMLCGVPVVSVDPLRQFEGVDFIDQRAVEVAYSYEEMEDALLRVNGKRGVPESFIKGIFARGEMSASQHIANHIRNFIASSDQAKIVE